MSIDKFKEEKEDEYDEENELMKEEQYKCEPCDERNVGSLNAPFPTLSSIRWSILVSIARMFMRANMRSLLIRNMLIDWSTARRLEYAICVDMWLKLRNIWKLTSRWNISDLKALNANMMIVINNFHWRNTSSSTWKPIVQANPFDVTCVTLKHTFRKICRGILCDNM